MTPVASVRLVATLSQAQFESGRIQAVRFRCEAESGEIAEFDVSVKGDRTLAYELQLSDLSDIRGPWSCTACAVNTEGAEGPRRASNPSRWVFKLPAPDPLESLVIE